MRLVEILSASCVFIHRNYTEGDTFVLIHVDYVLVLITSEQSNDLVINAVRSRYEVRVLNCIDCSLSLLQPYCDGSSTQPVASCF